VLAAENQLTSLVKSKICNVIRIRKTFEFTAKICLIRYIRVSIHMNHYSYPLIIGKIEFLSCTKKNITFVINQKINAKRLFLKISSNAKKGW
jgi:hypothetical protein